MIIDFLDENEHLNCWDQYIFKFKTNAKNFKIYLNVYEKPLGHYPHFGITAREGIYVMFRLNGDKNWYNLDAYARKSEININMIHFITDNTEYEVLMYGPLLSKLSKFYVDIPDEYYAEKIPSKLDRKILIVGGMQSLGIGCTTTSMAFSSILSREFETELYKITVNDKNYLEKIYRFVHETDYLPQADIGILELDYFNQDDNYIEIYLPDIIRFMKKYCKKIICWYSISKEKEYKKNKISGILENLVDSTEIIFTDLSFIHDKKHYEMCRYGPEFINDTGNIMIYKELKKCILEITEWNI